MPTDSRGVIRGRHSMRRCMVSGACHTVNTKSPTGLLFRLDFFICAGSDHQGFTASKISQTRVPSALGRQYTLAFSAIIEVQPSVG